MTEPSTRIVFICGQSGAGKSVALHTLEDLGYYCMDNFPIGLLGSLGQDLGNYPRRIAIGINVRDQETLIPRLKTSIRDLRGPGVDTELVFLESEADVLVKRYSETRRRHPYSGDDKPLHEAIAREYALLSPLAEMADLKIDTSHSNVHELRKTIGDRVAGRRAAELSILLLSFGYKHGTPRDADFIFDVRCLPNPYWDLALRDSTGRDADVITFLAGQPLVERMTRNLGTFLKEWIPEFEKENRSYLTIAAGCTGGRHRSVYIIDTLARDIRLAGRQVIIRHRDL